MKLRSSTKIAIGFTIIAAGSIYGYEFAMRAAIMGEKFGPIVPGNVNLVGISANSGLKILVVNEMAQLVQASQSFKGDETDTSESGNTAGSIKKHIPIRELLDVLKGDESKLGEFIMKVNDRDENDGWPPIRVIWTAERLNKAISGDKVERAKLVSDLNMELDGTPLPYLRQSSLENGIVIDFPIPVKVNVGGVQKTLVGRFLEPFKPTMMMAVEKQYADKQANLDTIRGYYAEAAKDIASGKSKKENVGDAIQHIMSAQNAKELAEYPEALLKSAQVVVSDSLISGAKYRSYETTNGTMYDLTIDLTDEGRRRLWQYSEDRVGGQIMLTENGIAIAAPRISHVLSQGELTITDLADKRLVQDVVDAINKSTSVKH